MKTCLLCVLLLAPLLAHAANPLPNGDFEGAFGDNGIAQGWADNSGWADLDVRYDREEQNPHGGRACQKVTCTRLASGAVQMIPTSGVPLGKGLVYRVRAWLRGDVPQAVAVQLREAPAPYRVYVEQGLNLKAQWQPVEYFWTSTVDDLQGRFMLRFTQEGTVWVDDVSCEEVSPDDLLRLAPPPPVGNLVANGSFELGLASWFLGHGCDYWQEPAVTIEPQPDGSHCLKLQVPAGIGVGLSSALFAVAPGRSLTISCRARAEPGIKLSLTSRCCGTSAQVGADWQTLRATGRVGFTPEPHDSVRVSFAGPVTLWLDDFSARQSVLLSPGAPRFEAAVLPDRFPLALYHDGEACTLRLLASGSPPAPVSWRVEDFWDKNVLSGTWQPTPKASARALSVSQLPRGWYRAEVSWRDGEGTRYHECTFVRLPPKERRGPIETSPFGAHFALDPSGIELAQAVGVRWLRLHPPNHTKWRVVEPEKGKWAWRDEPIRIAREAGFALCGSLDRLPTWASTAPAGVPEWDFYTGTGAYLPRDWAEWESYVEQTVVRYRGTIHVWEIWNEPNLGDWLHPRAGQTLAQAYLELMQHTYPVVKRVDPQATVIGGCVAGALTRGGPAAQFGRELLSLGASKYMDVFSFHDYIGESVDERADPIETWTDRLRQQMKAAGGELPIINSEGGYANPGTGFRHRPWKAQTVPSPTMARWLVRQYVSQWAAGVERFFFYNFFMDGRPDTQEWEGFVEGEGQPRPNVAAYTVMTWLLDGATFDATDRPDPDTWVHRFRTPRGPLWVAWRRTGTTGQLRVPGAVRWWDLMGVEHPAPKSGALTLTDAPVYVQFRPR